MSKQKNILMIVLLFLFGCSDKNPHQGLYNALFTDYNKRLSILEQNLTIVKENQVELEKEHSTINQNTTEKELLLNVYREEHEVSSELDKLEGDEENKIKLDKIKSIIYHMKEATINSYH